MVTEGVRGGDEDDAVLGTLLAWALLLDGVEGALRTGDKTQADLLVAWLATLPTSLLLDCCASLYEEAIEASGNRSRGAILERLVS